MSFQTPVTIANAISQIENSKYLVPAIQREFVWKHDRIEQLFDSLMQGYPISSFLFWEVQEQNVNQFKFYKIIKDFRERYKTHNEEYNTSGSNGFYAILDGQQRLTSLYIGLKGSFAYKTPRKKWEDNQNSLPTRDLYLNITKELSEQENGRKYQFQFLDRNLTNQKNFYDKDEQKWFRVSHILDYTDDKKLGDMIKNLDSEFARKSIRQLKRVIHERQIINFYLEEEQNLDKALKIFIRINSGGIALSFSDLIMSIAISNWKTKDARREILGLVDEIKNKDFHISKDLILKTFLYLYSTDIGFKVTNFSSEKAKIFEDNWLSIKNAILSTFDLIKSFGFDEYNLTSKNSIIPIIYYLYHRNIYKDFTHKVEFKNERKIIKEWLHIVLINRVFGGTSDSTLSQIRKVFSNDVVKEPIKLDIDIFPKIQMLDSIRKDMVIDYDNILNIQYEDKYAFSILSLLYPNLDYKNNNFHKDHLHPETSYELLSDDLKEKYSREVYNSIINLQMLGANENSSKQNKELAEWVSQETQTKNKEEFLDNHLIPDIDLSLMNFDVFVEKRKALIIKKLKELVGTLE
ncbi:DUF262 domain-containing protein [Moraxella nasovis]|uniref:DUF262 domain-containing protein n=1 Tax=Moraxella nasovis TaxID=2904121 RepID=UPI001F62174B|nr:DUF262 domain-containing protein [Moraxella nasovis]UNU73920.1 DUF262 domain-containing protein [Moraxella nasovis]